MNLSIRSNLRGSGLLAGRCGRVQRGFAWQNAETLTSVRDCSASWPGAGGEAWRLTVA